MIEICNDYACCESFSSSPHNIVADDEYHSIFIMCNCNIQIIFALCCHDTRKPKGSFQELFTPVFAEIGAFTFSSLRAARSIWLSFGSQT